MSRSSGEVLVELTAPVPLREADTLRISCSGDALNAAAAAAAAGASVALVTAVGDDELGDRILEFLVARGIDTTYVRRRPSPTASTSPARTASSCTPAGAAPARRSGPSDVERAPLREAGAVVVSGITQALSESCAAAVDAAVAAACGHVVYDPNFRAPPHHRGCGARRARARRAARGARHARRARTTPGAARHRRSRRGGGALRELGAGAVAVTLGARGLHLDAGDGSARPARAGRRVIDTTGAGDVLAGTAAARLALGDDLLTALRRATAAASRSLAGPGGTGWLPAAA